MNGRVNRYTIALLSAMIVCLLAVPATADYAFDGWDVTTRTNGTINGSVFIDSVVWNGQTTLTLSTDVPNGTVKEAYLYTGVWGGNPSNTGWHNVTFNGVSDSNGLGPIHLEGTGDNNSNVWCTGYGKYWWWYNVTNLVNASATNTAVTSKINGSLDGRVYGTVLVVVLENTSGPRIQYWINNGSDALNYQTPIDNGTTYFNGNVDNGSVTKSALTVVHLTGYSPTCGNCLDFNDHPLDTSMVDSNTVEVNTWDETNSNVKQENVTPFGNHADYRRGEDPYVNICNAILVLQMGESGKPDLTVDGDIEFPEIIRPNKNATINATITNQGSTSGEFNVSLYVNNVPNGTTVIDGLSASSSIDVNFTVNLSKGCYTFKVVADSGGVITESNEDNNATSENYQVGYVIIVECDDDFEKLSTTGYYALPDGCFKNESGTYYIQNLTVENCVGKGISIENTDAPFVINNCTVKNCTDSGIYFHNLSNGTVNGSKILNNTKYGIEVGLVPLDSSDPEFVDITNNTIEENLYGIELIGFNCIVKDNNVTDSGDYGIYLLANDTTVTDNTIQDNNDYGVKLYNSTGNYVYCNTFTDNNASNSGHQACDNGNTNYWNNATTGNNWSDWQSNPGYSYYNYSIDCGNNKDDMPNGIRIITLEVDDAKKYDRNGQGDDVTSLVNTSDDTRANVKVQTENYVGNVTLNFSGSTSGTIKSVIFNYEHQEDADDYVSIWLDVRDGDGGTWVKYDASPNSAADINSSCNVTSTINTVAEANNASIRYVCQRTSSGRAKYGSLDYANLTITYKTTP
jgi:parallel beta-helix repeat protein